MLEVHDTNHGVSLPIYVILLLDFLAIIHVTPYLIYLQSSYVDHAGYSRSM